MGSPGEPLFSYLASENLVLSRRKSGKAARGAGGRTGPPPRWSRREKAVLVTKAHQSHSCGFASVQGDLLQPGRCHPAPLIALSASGWDLGWPLCPHPHLSGPPAVEEMDALRRRPSPALQIRLRAPRVGLGPWSPDPRFRLARRETHQREHVPVGPRGLPTASEVAHCLWVPPGVLEAQRPGRGPRGQSPGGHSAPSCFRSSQVLA